MRRSFAFAVVAALWFAPGLHAAETPARAVVENLHDALLDVMKAAEELRFDGRRDYLAPVVSESYDMLLIARASTGRHWRQAGDAQKQRMVEALTRLSIATYAARFDDYAGESFRILSEQPAPRDTLMVNSEIVKSDGKTVRLNYLMHETDIGWRIIDVYLDGVYSELALRRADYAYVLKRRGFDGLFAEIEKKIADLEAEGRE